MKSLLVRLPVTSFTLLAFGLSWLVWIPLLGADLESLGPLYLVVLLLGGFGPTVSALILTGVLEGREGVGNLLRRFRQARVGLSTWVIALLTVPLIYAVAVVWLVGFRIEVDYINYLVPVLLPVFFVVATVFGPLAEELGWRGFALPRLLPAQGFLVASLVLGTIHTFWHLPLFWGPQGTSISGQEITVVNVVLYWTWVTGLTFIYTFLAKKSGHSVLIAFVFHATINGTGKALDFMLPNLTAPEKHLAWVACIVVTWVVVLIGALALRLRGTGPARRDLEAPGVSY